MYFHTLLFCLCTHLSSGSVLNPFRTTYLHILLYRAKRGKKCLFHLKQALIAMVTTYISLLSSAFIQMNSGPRHHDVGGGRSLAALMRSGLRDRFSPQQVMVCKISLAAFGSERTSLLPVLLRACGEIPKTRKVCGDFYRELAAAGRG